MTLTTVLSLPLHLPSGAVIPNRIAKAAMSETLADRITGAPTDALIQLYARWSVSGAGLLLTGNVMVDRGGLGEPGNVIVEDESVLPALRRWAEVAQANGAQLWMQLNHAGRQSPRQLTAVPVAPSAVPLKGMAGMFAPPRALEGAEIEAIIGRFANAAGLAKEAGFSGVQVHGAHGYLVSQFLSPLTNLRTDAWGGDAERRRRFVVEIVKAIRAKVGPGFPIGVKLNSADFQRGGFEVEEAMNVARALEEAGVDLLEISGGTYEKPAMTGNVAAPEMANKSASTRAREAYFLDYARQIRAVTRGPLLLTGGFRTAAGMADAVNSGAVDMVGLGRPMAAEPDLPARILDGRALAAAVPAPHSPIKQVDSLLQVVWYQEQFLRMGRGEEPDARLGVLGVLWRTITSRIGRVKVASPRSAVPAPADTPSSVAGASPASAA